MWRTSGWTDRWTTGSGSRAEIFDEVCQRGYDAERNTFTQYYGCRALDAALLLISSVGFLPATDKRVLGTIEAIEKQLSQDGFVQRYAMTEQTQHLDGLPPGEGTFLP